MSASLRDRPDQYDAFGDVQTRLTRDFGAVPVTVVEEVVRRRVSSLEGAHVTVCLPIFVEQASRHELSHLAAQPSRSAGGDRADGNDVLARVGSARPDDADPHAPRVHAT
jgi:uncharacterized protein (DUF2267 family)